MATTSGAPLSDQPKDRLEAKDYADLLQTDHCDAFAFSDQEQLVLRLYDQLKELELQQSLLEAQNDVEHQDVSALSDDVLQEQLTIAEREAMNARAEYELRNRTTHNVLIMDPVLKAVHGGERTDFAEKRILPLITENDTVSMVHGVLAAKLNATRVALNSAEGENIIANARNKELSAILLDLAEDAKIQSTKDIEDPQLRDQVTAVERNVKESKRRLRTLQGIFSGMIVGSGVNWAEDETLRELVMDPEDEV